jgi:hypothetical protein
MAGSEGEIETTAAATIFWKKQQKPCQGNSTIKSK